MALVGGAASGRLLDAGPLVSRELPPVRSSDAAVRGASRVEDHALRDPLARAVNRMLRKFNVAKARLDVTNRCQSTGEKPMRQDITGDRRSATVAQSKFKCHSRGPVAKSLN